MTIENQHDVDGLKRVGRIVSLVLHKMLDALEPGMTTRELDAIGARLLEEHGARSAPQLTYGFPAATCVSVNEEAAHGVPGDRVIRAGDLVNVDVSAELGGYFADTGGTRVTLAVEQAGPVGGLMGRFYRRLTDRYLATEAEGIKARSEGRV
jgi:methionyl aminopeptidase